MIKHWLITGDTHGRVCPRLGQIAEQYPTYKAAETAVIILGDAGINFYLNKSDKKNKQAICNTKYMVYCVRGNHEERPENISTMETVYDGYVGGEVYYEKEFPNIRYFIDGNTYLINGYTVLILGGAYSIDKWYRLNQISEPGAWCGWFEGEQLSAEEQAAIMNKIKGNHYDFVFSHTCPKSNEPTDLFLDFIDQSTVDKSMENWLEEVKNAISYGIWCFGHFHADRIESDCMEQFYRYFETMDSIYTRWYGGKEQC